MGKPLTLPRLLGVSSTDIERLEMLGGLSRVTQFPGNRRLPLSVHIHKICQAANPVPSPGNRRACLEHFGLKPGWQTEP